MRTRHGNISIIMRPTVFFLDCNNVYRATWLTVGRILRALSNNNHHSELRGLWASWSAPRGGDECCRAVWAALRPPTNCDEPALSKARDYIQQNMSQFTADDGIATSGSNLMIIADANQILKHAVLEYWSDNEVLSEKTPKKRAAFGAQVRPRKQITTPAAIYSYDAQALRHAEESGAARSARAEEEEADSRSSRPARTIGQFEELQDVRASIAPGSVINIKESVCGSSASASVGAAWFLVLQVDLLFARLRVRPCLAPPFPWLQGNGLQSEEVAGGAIWLPVSKVWFALVCSRVEAYLGVDR